MDLKLVCELLSTFVTYVAVTDREGQVLWDERNYLHDVLPRPGLKKSFSLTSLLDKPAFVALGERKRFRLAAKLVNGADEQYCFFLFEDCTDINSPALRLHCLEAIVESLNDGVIMSDATGTVTLYNRAQSRMDNISQQDFLGKKLWDGYCYYDPTLSEHEQVRLSKKSLHSKYRAHSKAGDIPHYEVYDTFPIMIDGEAAAVYSVSQSETEILGALSNILEMKRRLYSNTGVRIDSKFNNGTHYTFADMIGESRVMHELIDEAQNIAMHDTSILITGETGTGKEVLAQSIHNYSRQEYPFVAINCAAIPDSLLESILFGTVKGAYTGAVDKQGLFEQAGKGTLFLDELNTMSINLQSKLLRALSEKKVLRVGGSSYIPFSCRIISATNEDPTKLIGESRLREDLFFRIAGTCLFLPPLRDRQEDVRYLVQFFINGCNTLFNRRIKSCSPELWQLFESYQWPGNIRELEHFVKNIMARTKEDQTVLVLADIPSYLAERIANNIKKETASLENLPYAPSSASSLPDVLRSIEKQIILKCLDENKWNLTKAAQEMGIIRQSLYSRMKKLGISNENTKYYTDDQAR